MASCGEKSSREVRMGFSPPILLIFALSTAYPIPVKMSRKKLLCFSGMGRGHRGLYNLSGQDNGQRKGDGPSTEAAQIFPIREFPLGRP
jgi:hypothetical protein